MYTGPSIVDYLNSIGQPSDYTTRSNLAREAGITNYTGSAEQNSQLLSMLRSAASVGSPGSTTTANTGYTPTYDTSGVSRNYNDYSSMTPTPYMPNLRTQNPGESNLQYAGYILQSPFLTPDSSSSTGYRQPTQAEINTYTSNWRPPSDQDILSMLINSTNPTRQINMPTSSPTIVGSGGINGMMGYYNSLFGTYSQQLEDLKKQKEAAQKKQQEESGGWMQKLVNAKSTEQVVRDALATTGVNPAQYFAQEQAQIAEIGRLNEEYNAAVATRDKEIADTQQKLAPMSFINARTAQINRNAAPVLNQMSANINAKAATLQASQGMWAEAQKYVNQAVDAATADLKYNFDMYRELYNNNQDVINSLDKKYQTALQGAMDTAEKAFTFAQDQKMKVGQLMIENPQAGITIGDTLDQALAKVGRSPKSTASTVGSADTGYYNVIRDSSGRVISTQPNTGSKVTNTTKTSMTTGGTSAAAGNLSKTQVNNGAVNAGLDLNTFKSLDPNVQSFFAMASDKQVKAINDEIAKVKSGAMTADQVRQEIDSANISDPVKNYFKQIIASTTPPAASTSQPWYSKAWSGIKSFFGY